MFKTIIFIATLFDILTGKAFAEDQKETRSITIESLAIQLVASPAEIAAMGGEEEWKSGCRQFGRHFFFSQMTQGIFKSSKCLQKENPINTSEKTPWLLTVKPTKKGLEFTLFYHFQKTPVATTAVSLEHPGFDIFSNNRLNRLIAIHLLSQTPMMILATLQDLENYKEKKTRPNESIEEQLSQLLQEFDVFTIEYNKAYQSWVPEPLGIAKIVSKSGDSKIENTLQISLDPQKKSLAPETVVALRPTADHQVIQKKADDLIIKQLDEYKKNSFFWKTKEFKIMFFVTSGFVGIHYGQSVSNQVFLKDMKIFSLFLALRQKPLDGFVFRYENWPKVNNSLGLGPQQFKSERAMLGWAIPWPAKWTFLVDRVEFVPLIGSWSFDLKYLHQSQNQNLLTSEFSKKNSISGDFELGVEKSIFNVLIRAWVAKSIGKSLIKKGDGVTIQSFRLGSEMMVQLPALFVSDLFSNMRLTGFVQAEDYTVDRQTKSSGENIGINSINFSNTYVGGGFAVIL
jgi:hypothetical protein